MKNVKTKVVAAAGIVIVAATIICATALARPFEGRAAVAAPGQVPGCTPPSGVSAGKAQAWQMAPGCRTAGASSAQGAQAATAKAAAKAQASALIAAAATPGQLDRPAHAGTIGTAAQLGGVPVPFSPAVTTITNMYLDLTPDGTEYLAVYAGAHVSDPAQGILFIKTDNPVDGTSTVDAYPLPKAGGIASLVSDTATSIVVGDADGDQFTFDIQARTWA